jgi:hypothetical protein
MISSLVLRNVLPVDPATDAPGGAFDVALLAVKAYDAEAVARAWAPHVRDVVPVERARPRHLVGPSRPRQTEPQLLDVRLVDRDVELPDLRHDTKPSDHCGHPLS